MGVDGSALQEKLKEAKDAAEEAAGDVAEELKDKVAEEKDEVEHDEL